MDGEAAFLAGYAVALVAVAAGLERLGRRPTDPWSSKLLAAGRASRPQRPGEPGWPHSEVPQFHVGVGGVALAATLLLSVVSLVRHHTVIEIIIQFAVVALIIVRAARLARLGGARRPSSSR